MGTNNLGLNLTHEGSHKTVGQQGKIYLFIYNSTIQYLDTPMSYNAIYIVY